MIWGYPHFRKPPKWLELVAVGANAAILWKRNWLTLKSEELSYFCSSATSILKFAVQDSFFLSLCSIVLLGLPMFAHSL